MSEAPSLLAALMQAHAQDGCVTWIGTRPARREPLVARDAVEAIEACGLAGDRYVRPGRRTPGKRQVSLIQAEHLDAVASLLGRAALPPELVRRNLVVRGLNLLALKGARFRVGDAVLEYTGLCAPCSRMEEVLGPGGYSAMRGHGGIVARVITGGTIRLGDGVSLLAEPQSSGDA